MYNDYGTRMAIKILEGILDDKELKSDTKKVLRDIVAPAIEFVANAPSPREVMERVRELKVCMVVPLAIALHMSVSPKSYQELALAFGEDDYKQLKDLLDILQGLMPTGDIPTEKTKAQTVNTD